MNQPPARPPRGPLRASLLVLCAAGLALSLLLTRMSLPSESALTILGAAVCAPTASVNCDYVLASRWSKIGSIPVAAFGAVYFAALAAWFIGVGLPNRAGRRWHWPVIALVTVGACASAFYVYILAARLPVWCHLCAGVHAINALILFLCIAGYPRRRTTDEPRTSAGDSTVQPQPSSHPPYPSRPRALAVVGLTLAVAWAAGMTLLALQMKLVARKYQLDALAATNNADYIIWRLRETPKRDIPLLPDDQGIGPLEAPYSVVVFSDFECTNCAGFHRYAYRLAQLFPDAVRIVFKHYPLSPACNAHVKAPMHYFACDAAVAYETMRRLDDPARTYRYQQALFENRQRFDERPYESLAASVGIDSDTWTMSQSPIKSLERIAQDVDLAHTLGVESTPTLFLKGRRLVAWHILTTGASPVVDLAATDALWEKLLHTTAKPLAARTGSDGDSPRGAGP